MKRWIIVVLVVLGMAGAATGGFFWGRHEGHAAGYRAGIDRSKQAAEAAERPIVMPLLLASDVPGERLFELLGWTEEHLHGADPTVLAELLNSAPSPDRTEATEGKTLASVLADGAGPREVSQAGFARDLLAAGRTIEESRRRLYTQVRFDFDTTGAIVLGSADPVLEIVWWSDFQCPYCARGWPVIKEILERYPDSVAFVVMDLPLRMHTEADEAARAAWAAGQQDRFVEMADLLYDKRKKLKRHIPGDGGVPFERLAKKAELDMERYRADYAAAEEVLAEHKKQAKAAGLTRVPSFYFGGNYSRIRVTVDDFSDYIDRVLAGDDPSVAPRP